MTDLLKKAFNEASNLPEAEQDLLAAWILEEIRDSSHRWDESFARPRTKLRQMAAEALEDYRQGRTELLDPDQL